MLFAPVSVADPDQLALALPVIEPGGSKEVTFGFVGSSATTPPNGVVVRLPASSTAVMAVVKYPPAVASEAARMFVANVLLPGIEYFTGVQKPMAEIANGKIFMASDALSLGLIDEIGYQEDAYKYAATKAGLKNMMVVKYRDPPTIFDALSSKSNVGGAVNVSGVHVNAGDVRELLMPRLMYLWRGR